MSALKVPSGPFSTIYIKMVKKKQIKHVLIPEHEKASEREKKAVLEKYNLSMQQFPRISKKDPAIQHLSVNDGDLIKITRNSKTAGEAVFYRVVSNV